MSDQSHVVFLNVAQTGHMNPTLPVVAELVARKCKVTYFVGATMQSFVEAAGAEWRPFRFTHDPKLSAPDIRLDERGIASLVPEGTPKEEYAGPQSSILYWAEQMLPTLVEDLRALAPAPGVLVYDPFLPAGRVAARAMGIPAISMVTIPGPGVVCPPPAAVDALEALPWVEKPRQAMADKYGLDVLAEGMIMASYSPVENIVATIDELFSPPCTEKQIERFGHFPFSCVGVLMDTKVKRLSNAYVGITVATPNDAAKPCINSEISETLPIQAIQDARQAGRKILFVSLGTVATSVFWEIPFGPSAVNNEIEGKAEEEDRRSLSEHTGKEFCQHAWRTCFEAFGGNDAFLVIMALGAKEDALEGLPPVPTNFLVRDAVPQLEVLRLCDAMVTHAGANSMHEALGFGVPLVAVPIFGDQPANADTIARSGAGVSFRYPLSTMSASSLRAAVMGLVASGAENSFVMAARAMGQKFKEAGGAPAAADIILRHAPATSSSKWGGC